MPRLRTRGDSNLTGVVRILWEDVVARLACREVLVGVHVPNQGDEIDAAIAQCVVPGEGLGLGVRVRG